VVTQAHSAPQLALSLPQAHLSAEIPRLNLALTAGRQTLSLTQRPAPVDGVEGRWSPSRLLTLSAAWGVSPRALDAGALTPGAWGAGWRTPSPLGLNALPVPPSALTDPLTPLSPTETSALYSDPGWRAAAALSLTLPPSAPLSLRARLSADLRRTARGSAEERAGLSVAAGLGRWRLASEGAYDPLSGQMTRLSARLEAEARASFGDLSVALSASRLRPVWASDTLWWVFWQRPERRLSAPLRLSVGALYLRLEPSLYALEPYASRGGARAPLLGERGVGAQLEGGGRLRAPAGEALWVPTDLSLTLTSEGTPPTAGALPLTPRALSALVTLAWRDTPRHLSLSLALSQERASPLPDAIGGGVARPWLSAWGSARLEQPLPGRATAALALSGGHISPSTSPPLASGGGWWASGSGSLSLYF
jgi:hypothetical protein